MLMLWDRHQHTIQVSYLFKPFFISYCKMENSRLNRETFTFNNRIMYLDDVKQLLLNDALSKGIQLNAAYFYDHPFTSNIFERYAYYLHYLIMFKNPSHVNGLLDEHRTKYGSYATNLFVNFPLVSVVDKNVITPIQCACLWSKNPEMVRVLYYWGADISVLDVNGKYPEEKYGSYYVNHLNHLMAQNHFVVGLRITKEFTHMIEEIRILSNEITAPPGWYSPGSAYTTKFNSRTRTNSHRSPLTQSIPEEASTAQSENNA